MGYETIGGRVTSPASGRWMEVQVGSSFGVEADLYEVSIAKGYERSSVGQPLGVPMRDRVLAELIAGFLRAILEEDFLQTEAERHERATRHQRAYR